MGTQGGLGDFKMEIQSHYRNPLARVLREAIEIQELENMEFGWSSVEADERKVKCLNSKQDFSQNSIPRTVHIRGN